MSAAVEASHRSYFSPSLDTMARPGSGWGYDPYAPRHGGYVQDHQYSQTPQPMAERLPGPSSLFSSRSAASPLPHAPVPSHQYPTSPPGRDAHYNGNPRPPYYGVDYASPPPMAQTPPLLHGPGPDPHYQPLAPRRHPDVRLSPTQSSTTSERSEDLLPPDGSRGYAGHFIHPAASSSKGAAVYHQASASAPNLGHHIHQPSRAFPHHEDNLQAPTAGGLMGKLVPQSYSANGRQIRSTAPPTPTMNPAPHRIQTNLPSQQQSLQTPSERQPVSPAYHATSPQQYQIPPHRQKYSTSPPPMPSRYPPQMEQYQPMAPQHQHQQSRSSMSPLQEPVKMSIHSLLSGDRSGGGGGNGVASSASGAAEFRAAGPFTSVGAGSAASSPSTSSQKAPAAASEYRGSSSSSQKVSALSSMTSEFRIKPTGSQKTPALSPGPSPSEYRIEVRQQPVAARSCGFGERDRRVIDPPPIVQLFYENQSATQEDIAARIRHPFSVVHCSIWNETGEQDSSAMSDDYKSQRRLMGTLVASPFVGLDDKGEEGCFFCFPDLSCRTPGNFRLKFSLVVISPGSMQLGSKAPILGTAMSAVFTVYNAKDFPGMQASTPLTKRLKEQGCLISIKKGNDKSGGPGSSGGGGGNRDRDDSDDDDDEDAGGGGGAGPSSGGAGPANSRRKRQRKT